MHPSRPGPSPRWLARILTCLLVLAASASVATAHPHVTIDTRSDLVLDDKGQIIAINVEWTFDDMYSLAAVEGLDANGDGHYDPEEIHILATENIESLKEFDYFVYAKAKGEKVAYGEVTEFGNLFNKGVLTFYFRLPLAVPIDPSAVEFSYAIYDPSYYIAIGLAEADPIQVIGSLKDPCRIEVTKSAAEADNFQYTEEFWDAQANEGMGSMFAQTIAVKCDASEKKAAQQAD